MFRTQEKIAVRLKDDWDNVKNSTIRCLEETFHTHPNWFFTEHDIHSVLYKIAKEELQSKSVISAKTADGYQVMLVHHEYPTPFRCYMKGYVFQLKVEKPYKRGHYDLVILNPQFVRNNKLQVVCGKDYQKFRLGMQKVRVEPLIWACEVIFFSVVKKIPKNALKIIEQDTLKVKETLRYKVGQNNYFCKTGSILVFTSHTAEEVSYLKQQVARLEEKHYVKITFINVPACTRSSIAENFHV